MAVLVGAETISVTRGTAVLLDGVSAGIVAGDRIGVVGRNGAGKTTLVRVLAGLDPPDSGRVTRAGGTTVSVLAQADSLDPSQTVRQALLGDAAEHTWAADAALRGIVEGLELSDRLELPIGPLSGGERRRVALALALLAEADLLVLDEPTNHLDVEGVAWLAGHLRARRGALLAVTHDRWFLDAVCDQTWEVTGGRVHTYEGGYAAFVLARAERERVAAVTESRRQNLLRKELAWLRRGAPARTSKPKFRLDAAAALIEDEPPPRDPTALQAFATARLGKQVLELDQVSVALGGKQLLDGVERLIGPGDRVAVVGANGAGKTTLLRLLDGELAPDAGTVRTGRTVRVQRLDQQPEHLDPNLRVLESVEQIARVVDLGGGREVSASSLLERFGFPADRQWTPVGRLSGGERRRLQLLRLLLGEPNVLLLDEPTNDLDVDTLVAIEDLLDAWPGTLVVVSHDRYFLERTTDVTLALLGDGRLRELTGGVEEYLRRRRTAPPASSPSPAVRAPVADSGASRAAKKEIVRLERAMDRASAQEAELMVAMEKLAADRPDDHAALTELALRVRAGAAAREAAEAAWLEAAAD